MSKMYIMKGLPGCGKSTIANGMIINQGNLVRINKDLIRKMLHFNKFTPQNENLTVDAAITLAKMYLGKGIDVIIDDTNLNQKTMDSWISIAKECKAKYEIVDLTDVPIEDCIMRDTAREDSVGGIVIKNMALRAGIKKFDPNSVILCDIDGTISDPSHRLHYVKDLKEGEKKDWKSFFEGMVDDTIRQDMQKMLIQFYNEGKTIIFMSGRPENYRDVTLRWLQTHFLTFAYTVLMRKSNDKRPDTEVKRELLEQHFPDKKVIHTIFDDRPSVINVWKEMGLPVVDVGKGEEF